MVRVKRQGQQFTKYSCTCGYILSDKVVRILGLIHIRKELLTGQGNIPIRPMIYNPNVVHVYIAVLLSPGNQCVFMKSKYYCVGLFR